MESVKAAINSKHIRYENLLTYSLTTSLFLCLNFSGNKFLKLLFENFMLNFAANIKIKVWIISDGAIIKIENIIPFNPLKEYRYAVESPKPKPWKIGIKNPTGCPNGKNPKKNKTIIEIVELKKEEKNVMKMDCSTLFLRNFCIKKFNWFNVSVWFTKIKIVPNKKLNVKSKNKILNKSIFFNEKETKNFFPVIVEDFNIYAHPLFLNI